MMCMQVSEPCCLVEESTLTWNNPYNVLLQMVSDFSGKTDVVYGVTKKR